MYTMRRVVVLDHLDNFRAEISPRAVDAIDVIEELDGKHELKISTYSVHLTIGDRVLVAYAPDLNTSGGDSYISRYKEYVVYGIKSTHGRTGAIRTEYTCIWFLQYDSTGIYVDTTVGVTPCQPSVQKTASNWFTSTIGNTYEQSGSTWTSNGNPTWTFETSGVPDGSAAFYNTDGWETCKKFVERWGAEMDCHTDVYYDGRIIRYVVARGQLGSSEPVMRFDYGWDVKNIERTVHDGVWGCRVVPLGKSTQTENGGYSRRPTISSANRGVPWLENANMVPLVRRPKIPPEGSSQSFWFLPTVFVKNDTYEDPAELKAWAQAHLTELTQPKVTYKMDALSVGEMGLARSPVHLGDVVMVVDRTLVDGGIRVETRVVKMEYSVLGDHTPVKLTLGTASTSITNAMMATNDEVRVIREQLDLQQT